MMRDIASERATHLKRFWYVVHNVVAHPLMVVWPRVGNVVHEWTGRRI
jgi:ribosomal protein L11 methylase PrmA